LVAIRLFVFVVVALVVEAFKVRKLPVVPHNVVIVANTEFKSDVKILEEFKLVMVDDAAVIVANVEVAVEFKEFDKDTCPVIVALVKVALLTVKLVLTALVLNEFVVVASVKVAFVPVKFVNVPVVPVIGVYD
jgi:hypothetical protein